MFKGRKRGQCQEVEGERRAERKSRKEKCREERDRITWCASGTFNIGNDAHTLSLKEWSAFELKADAMLNGIRSI